MNAIRKNRVALIKKLKDVYLEDVYDDDIIDNFRLEVLSKIRAMPHEYLAYSEDDPSRVSYAARPEHRYDSSKRVKTTITRYIRRRLGMVNTISDDMLDKIYRPVFADRVVEREQNNSFRIISGDMIQSAYREAIGCDSCMSNDNSWKVKLYVNNPDKVKMVIYKHTARALLWECDDGTKVMDRIYPNDGSHIDIMRSWARSNDIVYRVSSSLPSGDIDLSDDKIHYVTLKRGDDVYPYMDTFTYGEFDGGEVILCNYQEDNELCFQNTNGKHGYTDDDEHFYCEHCGDYYADLDMHEDGNYYCESCIPEEEDDSEVE